MKRWSEGWSDIWLDLIHIACCVRLYSQDVEMRRVSRSVSHLPDLSLNIRRTVCSCIATIGANRSRLLSAALQDCRCHLGSHAQTSWILYTKVFTRLKSCEKMR